jgi:multidrug resistance efflux pump
LKLINWKKKYNKNTPENPQGKRVRTLQLKPQSALLTEVFTGTFKAPREAFLTVKTPGILEKLFFHEGDFIEATNSPQVLAQTDAKTLELELQVKQQELKMAQNQLLKLQQGNREEEIEEMRFKVKSTAIQEENARWNAQKIEQLFRERLVSEKAFQDAQAQVTSLTQTLQQFKSIQNLLEKGSREEDVEAGKLQCDLKTLEIQVLRQKLEETKVYAPFSGFIAECRGEIGEYQAPSQVLFHYIDLSEILLEIGVPEYLLPRLQLHQEVSIECYAFPQHSFLGKISKIPLVSPAHASLFPVEIRIANPEKRFKPGMRGKACITLDKVEEQYVFSLNYTLPLHDQKIVFVVDKGYCRKVVLSSFRSHQGNVILPIHQLPSSELILSGLFDLSDGDLLQILPQQTTE